MVLWVYHMDAGLVYALEYVPLLVYALLFFGAKFSISSNIVPALHHKQLGFICFAFSFIAVSPL